MRNGAERTEQHTLTVREVARLFEDAGVPRTERSIINWCQPNRQGVARLDAFFDANERKYFITPQSVSLAVQEESAKKAPAARNSGIPFPRRSADEEMKHPSDDDVREGKDIRDLWRKITDLEITNQVKEQYVELLQQERGRLVGEREGYVRELMAQSRRIGELETQVLQLGPPARASSNSISDGSERILETTDNVGASFREAGTLEADSENPGIGNR